MFSKGWGQNGLWYEFQADIYTLLLQYDFMPEKKYVGKGDKDKEGFPVLEIRSEIV